MGSLSFSLLIATRRLQDVWFAIVEWWVFPTGKFWALAGVVFFVSLATSYVFSIWRGWLEAPTQWHRVLIAAGLGGVIPLFLSFLSKPNTSVIGFFLSPVVVALFLSAALFALTSAWYKSATALMVLVYLVAPLVAGIPEQFVSGGSSWFDAVTFSIRTPLLIALCGWWLARARLVTSTTTTAT